ncbi:hypothetical protein NLG97_g6507 [Lecanicillium saksenae]|uniref:Uncharacterized protein n=1 Tax=Lecanicillium saksenae TaxID=468837 RepID=A0ACC1QQ09_9HYPO|nr:hypothetical protein NLG97_g6507 [Lecanicillium saksenae]
MRRQLRTPALALATLLFATQAVSQVATDNSTLDDATAVSGNKNLLKEPTEDPDIFYSDLHPCPRACDGKHSDEWDLFTSVARIQYCTEPMLIDMPLYNPLHVTETVTAIRACTQGDSKSRINAAFHSVSPPPKNTTSSTQGASPTNVPRLKRLRRLSEKCVVGNDTPATLQLSMFGSSEDQDRHLGAAAALLGHLSEYFRDDATCHTKSLFALHNGTATGVYAGKSINKASVQTVVEAVAPHLAKERVANATAQVCDSTSSPSDVIGVAVFQNGDLAAIQKAFRLWDHADCNANLASPEDIHIVIKAEAHHILNGTMTNHTSPYANQTSSYANTTLLQAAHLRRRGTCSTRNVERGDDCSKLAGKCGISLDDFEKYNSKGNMCNGSDGLKAGMIVCCTDGDLPDLSKKPDADGYCATHYVGSGDDCSTIAMQNGITVEDLEKFNQGKDGTWGWSGCGANLQAYINICVSEGLPPMPAPVANAVCGPIKPGSTRPTGPDAGSLLDMNPCPLNACCNVWGNCGLSDDFCVDERGPTGNPGTSPKAHWGCISNCGRDIVSSDAPQSYGRVGYYESWNFERKCLYLKAENANTDGSYTIIHWAFMEIDTTNWMPRVKDPHNQWEGFKRLQGVKKVISFGGWGYSTAPETYDILREAMKPENRFRFAGNTVKFIVDNNLDGVDFDWEYPGAMDIPDTPKGFPEDGPNYLAFLIVMGNMIHGQPPFHYTLSMAAPASFWYLKAFPIKEMAKHLDYLVYMTYDLHGQWDAGNQWSSEGCPGGNCLRSHVNLTETTTALAMITKAGVPSNKIYVGEASYGRSFKMSQEGCDGPDCTFTGDRLHSDAAKGTCTNTSGYISHAEIAQLAINDGSARLWHDGASNSDIMVYQDTEWVAYMSPATKGTRRTFWQGKNFAGTIDWAVDLMDYHSGDEAYGLGEDDGSEFQGGSDAPGPCKATYTSLDDIANDRDKLSLHCREKYTLEVLAHTLKDSLTKHDKLIADNYDHNFDIYAGSVSDNIRATVKDFMYKNASSYFDCKVTELVDSCKHCKMFGGKGLDKKCRYCEDYDCGYQSFICGRRVCSDHPWHKYHYYEKDFACPPDFSQRSDEPDKNNLVKTSTRWILKNGKADEFKAAMLAGTAVPDDKVVWEDVRWAAAPVVDGKDSPMYMDFNFPNPKHFTKADVANPKEVIDKGRSKLDSFLPNIDDVLHKIDQNQYGGFVGDLVDAISVPIVMAQQSVSNMQQANDIGAKIDEENKEKLLEPSPCSRAWLAF